MRSKVLLGALAGIGLVALSVTVAHAGGGQGGGVTGNSFFACHGINGGDVGAVVNIRGNQFFGDTDETNDQFNVRVGSGVLVCTQVRVTQGTGVDEVDLEGPEGADHLKCFTVSASRPLASPPAATPTLYDLEDPFGTEANVQVAESRYLLCVPAKKTVVVP